MCSPSTWSRVLPNIRSAAGLISIFFSSRRRHTIFSRAWSSDVCSSDLAAPGHDKPTLAKFFDALGEDRCAQVRLVSADAAEWIGEMVRERCENATVCLDPFHIVSWATDALDVVRREVWNTARRAGVTGHAKDLKGARYALWKNPENLTARQRAKLAWVATLNGPLYRAYLLKEQLREVFSLRGAAGIALLDRWL